MSSRDTWYVIHPVKGNTIDLIKLLVGLPCFIGSLALS